MSRSSANGSRSARFRGEKTACCASFGVLLCGAARVAGWGKGAIGHSPLRHCVVRSTAVRSPLGGAERAFYGMIDGLCPDLSVVFPDFFIGVHSLFGGARKQLYSLHKIDRKHLTNPAPCGMIGYRSETVQKQISNDLPADRQRLSRAARCGSFKMSIGV